MGKNNNTREMVNQLYMFYRENYGDEGVKVLKSSISRIKLRISMTLDKDLDRLRECNEMLTMVFEDMEKEDKHAEAVLEETNKMYA